MNRDDTKKSSAKNPFDNANVISKYFYWWLRDIFKIGSARQIIDDDMYNCVDRQKSENVSKQFQFLWDAEMSKLKPSLAKVILKAYIFKVIAVGILFSMVQLPCELMSPFFMGYLIAYFMSNPYNHTEQQAYLFATGIAVLQIVLVLVFHPTQLWFFESALKLRIACCSLIYKKILSLTKFTTTDGIAGHAVNLMSNDVSRFDWMVCFIHNLWIAPLGSVIAGFLIFNQIGFAGLIGCAVLILTMPIQAWLGKKSAQVRMKSSTRTDARVKFMFSILNGIQIIKMYAWENSFRKIISAVRKIEVKAIGKSSNIKAALLSSQISTQIAIFLSLVAYVLMGNSITAQKAFVTIAYFNYINHALVEYWPLALTSVAEGIVSVRRVEQFLLHKVSAKTSDESDKNQKSFGLNRGVNFRNASAYWNQDGSSSFGIQSIDLNIGKENLTAVIGQVGSGKTTLLETILTELPLTGGVMEVNGKISYASQQPWIFEGSIKSNILFTSVFDETRYKKVVHICALERDFELFPHGDETIVGDRGMNLSGGQKARMNLARAVYRDADLYLIDDSLSAVDVNVGEHIFEKCIKEFLKDKICVFVTHQLQYLQDVKHIVVMNAGQIQVQGSYEDVKENTLNLLGNFDKNVENVEHGGDEKEKGENDDKETETSSDDEEQQITKETQQEGKVASEIYKSYFAAVKSVPFVALVAFLLLMTQVFHSGISYFISIWVNWEEKHGNQSNLELQGDAEFFDPLWWTTNRFIYFYAGGIAALTIAMISGAFAFYRMCLRASINLHDKIFNGIIRSKMYFFNANSTGRILNRFSKDIGAIDSQLPVVVIDVIKFFLELFGIVTIVSIINPWLLIPTMIMFAIFVTLRRIFLKTARDIKRIEAITRSPMVVHTTATLEGLSTVRAFQAENRLIHEYDQHQNLNSSAWFLFVATSRGFAFYVDFISSLYITSIIYSFLVLGTDAVGSNVGLAITQAINLIGMCNWGLRQTAELENQMTSVERIIEYTKIPSERSLTSKPEVLRSLPENFANRGVIEFKNVSVKYSDDGEFVLRNLNFKVNEKEKVGIVGRTGAGKSSLTQALFELAIVDGDILIDDIPTKSLGLHTFRQKISIIPQNPTLFVGSLRDNLDPMEEKSDDEIWRALNQVELKNAVEILNGGLDTKVSEGGSNFSTGQKQLVCLARAILKDNKILILDEATANIDTETDNSIQTTIRRQFSDCTVITVAHRLNTVIDNDRIIVLDAGKIVEFDTPRKLMENTHGVFAKLMNKAGLSFENTDQLKIE